MDPALVRFWCNSRFGEEIFFNIKYFLSKLGKNMTSKQNNTNPKSESILVFNFILEKVNCMCRETGAHDHV